jgi:hypothetical protein
LFIETKTRASSSVRTAWKAAAARAKKEGKTPVLMLFTKNKPGALVVCHELHLAAVAAELAVAPGPGPGPSEADPCD